MQPLNAFDSIAPAFTRTHQTLFQPFRLGRSWKLAASQALGFLGAMFIPFPLFVVFFPSSLFHGMPAVRTFLFGAASIYTLVYLLILYFCARMELVAFEMLVTRAKVVAPMWRRYSARIWPWFGFKVLIGTVYAGILAAILFPSLRHLIQNFVNTFQTLQPPIGGKPDPEAMQALVAPIMQQMANLQMLSSLILFLLKIPSTLLNDFVLPFFVLEDISLTAALVRGFDVFRADPLQVLLYLVLKPILFVIGYIMQCVAMFVAIIPLLIVFVIAAVIVGVTAHTSGSGMAIALAFLGYIMLFVYMLWISIALIGYFSALLEAYGIYFLGSRYPLLGNMLEPARDGPFTPPPVFPSEDEQEDDDGGPPMPMNPAVA